ncbi:MAG: phosphoribosylformylglycinamidine synthase subunit PurL [Bacillota bacterium]
MTGKGWRQLGLTDDEYKLICADLGRDPNRAELNMYSVMWSEHCSYKHSKSSLRLFPTEGKRVLQGPGENAGVVDLGGGWAAAFKIESHNHPSAVEPYQGAATGVGGIIRDIFTMGARPVAMLNSLRFGTLDDARGRYLFDGVVAGIGGYGNCIGIPTVAGEIYFEQCYKGNPLVNAMCVGVLPVERLVLGKAAGAGNLVVLVGARTGRDGIHGVTFASEELSEASEEKRPSVQVGDPFLEKLLMEACLEVIEQGLVVGVQDLGGAGLTCAVTETASRAGTGIELDLDKVPLREEGMEPFEIMVSESQERMLLIVAPEQAAAVEAVFKRWGLLYTVIGQVTGDGMILVNYRGAVVARVPAASVAGGAPEYEPAGKEPAYYRQLSGCDPLDLLAIDDYDLALRKVLGSLDIASKEWVWRRYDHMVRTCTVQGPGGDAAVIRLRETGQALAMSVDGNGRQVYLDPYKGGMMAVAEATRNLACVGAEPLGITDCLNFGNPEKPEIFWQFRRAGEGMAEACRVLEVPVVGGNVSFYNEVEGEPIFPTPVVGAVGLLESPERQCTAAFRQAGDLVFLMGAGKLSLGGSQLLKALGQAVTGFLPPIDLELEKRLQELLRRAVREGILASAHDLSDGGLAAALAESCIAGGLGAIVQLVEHPRPELPLFGEGPSRVIVSLDPANREKLAALADTLAVPLAEIGHAGGERLVISMSSKKLIDTPVGALKKVYEEALPCVME